MSRIVHLVSVQAPAALGFIYDYQTLITGILAVGAALIAAVVAGRQLRAQRDQLDEIRKQNQQDRSGRLRAARASLPTTLSLICDYAQAAGKGLNEAWPAAATLYPNDANPLENYRIQAIIPTFPAEAVRSLERVVEFTTSEDVAERIESILREAQVLESRTRGLSRGESVTTDNLAAYIIQTASIYARAESLFDYARRASEGVAKEPLWDRTFTAFNIMGVRTGQVLNMARRQRDRGDPPGEAETRPIY